MIARWFRIVGSGSLLAAGCLLAGCQSSGSGSGSSSWSKINWPWRSKTPTVPAAPAAAPARGGDPFLPPVTEPRTESPPAATGAGAAPKVGTSNYRADARTAGG